MKLIQTFKLSIKSIVFNQIDKFTGGFIFDVEDGALRISNEDIQVPFRLSKLTNNTTKIIYHYIDDILLYKEFGNGNPLVSLKLTYNQAYLLYSSKFQFNMLPREIINIIIQQTSDYRSSKFEFKVKSQDSFQLECYFTLADDDLELLLFSNIGTYIYRSHITSSCDIHESISFLNSGSDYKRHNISYEQFKKVLTDASWRVFK